MSMRGAISAVAVLMAVSGCASAADPTTGEGSGVDFSAVPTPDPKEIQVPVDHPGGAAAVWRVASGEQVDSSTRVFVAEVSRLGCNSGVTGKVLAPVVQADERRVVVTFAVARLKPRAGTCQANDWVPYEVALGEPLGDRRLVHGECLPGGQASTTSFCRAGGR